MKTLLKNLDFNKIRTTVFNLHNLEEPTPVNRIDLSMRCSFAKMCRKEEVIEEMIREVWAHEAMVKAILTSDVFPSLEKKEIWEEKECQYDSMKINFY